MTKFNTMLEISARLESQRRAKQKRRSVESLRRAAVFLTLIFAAPMFAADFVSRPHAFCEDPCAPKLCGPSVYCRKPAPCVPVPAFRCDRDCYCRKPAPNLVAPKLTCRASGQHRKPIPCLCWPPAFPCCRRSGSAAERTGVSLASDPRPAKSE